MDNIYLIPTNKKLIYTKVHILCAFKEYLSFSDEVDEKEWFEKFKKK